MQSPQEQMVNQRDQANKSGKQKYTTEAEKASFINCVNPLSEQQEANHLA